MKREEYQGFLKKCDLTAEQVQAMGTIIEERFPIGRFGFIEGWTDGMNSVCRFIDGGMEGHDEFEDEYDAVTPDHDGLVAQADSALALPFAMLAEIISPCAIDVATQLKAVLSEEQQQAFGAAMKSLAAPKLMYLLRFLDGRELFGESSERYFGARGIWWVEFIKSWDCK